MLSADGRVTGARVADSTVFTARRAVMLATGTYLADHRLVAALDVLPGYRSWCPDGSTGDGLRLATDLGASVRATRNNLAIMLGYEDPADIHALAVGAPSVREIPRAHVIMVNAAGERFGNEGAFQEYAPALRIFDVKARKPKNLPCWMISMPICCAMGLRRSAPGSVPDWVTSAPDIATLADLTGIDPQGLATTIARFNGFAESGIDADFGRAPGWALTPGAGGGRNPSLGAIERAPFHAVKLRPTLGVGGGGIKPMPMRGC